MNLPKEYRYAGVEYSKFLAASIVGTIFQVMTLLVLVGGGATAIVVFHNTQDWRGVGIIVASSIFLAAAFAFFGYMLLMMRALVLDSRRVAKAFLPESDLG